MNGQEYVKYDFDYHHRQQNMVHEQHSYHATNYQNHNDCNRFPVIEPPSWACPARGESTLEVRIIHLNFSFWCPEPKYYVPISII